MLERVDRMLLAVHDRDAAAQTFERLLGAQRQSSADSAALQGRGHVLALGESQIEVWEPAGPGPVAAHLERFGEGLMHAGYASTTWSALRDRLQAQGVPFVEEAGRLYLAAADNRGFPMVISAWQQRARVGPVSFFYEATHALDDDWREIAAHHAGRFGLDAQRFAPIDSPRFGYEGTLTMFDPVARLDRIELSQTFAGKPGAMRRFVERRAGNALYMCFIEAHDFTGLRDRLLAGGATVTGRGGAAAQERDTMWVHPRNLHGMLLGISRPDFAWIWSGQPDRVPALED